MEVLEQHFEKNINSSAAVVLWNYWDHEHLCIVHDHMNEAHVLFEDENLAIILMNIKIPYFPFLSSTNLSTFTFHGKYHFSDFQMLRFGIPFCSTIKIEEVTENSCRIHMHYRYFLKGYRKIIFKPLLKLMAQKWNEDLWLEDLELKQRRQKVLRSGFVDFVGMPKNLEDRANNKPLVQNIPVPRPRNSPIDKYRIRI